MAKTIPAAGIPAATTYPRCRATGGGGWADAPDGRTLEREREAKAWQWEIAHLRSHHALAASTLPCVTNGQHAPVWFLSGDLYDFGRTITETCTVPAGRYVFIDYPSVECSTVEPPPFHAKTDAGLLRCARSFGPGASSLAFDGQVLSPSGVVVATAVLASRCPRSTIGWRYPARPAGTPPRMVKASCWAHSRRGFIPSSAYTSTAVVRSGSSGTGSPSPDRTTRRPAGTHV